MQHLQGLITSNSLLLSLSLLLLSLLSSRFIRFLTILFWVSFTCALTFSLTLPLLGYWGCGCYLLLLLNRGRFLRAGIRLWREMWKEEDKSEYVNSASRCKSIYMPLNNKNSEQCLIPRFPKITTNSGQDLDSPEFQSGPVKWCLFTQPVNAGYQSESQSIVPVHVEGLELTSIWCSQGGCLLGWSPSCTTYRHDSKLLTIETQNYKLKHFLSTDR